MSVDTVVRGTSALIQVPAVHPIRMTRVNPWCYQLRNTVNPCQLSYHWSANSLTCYLINQLSTVCHIQPLCL